MLAFNLSTRRPSRTAISGSGGLTQMGPSLLTLTGSNTYSGATTIASGGTLQIGNGGTRLDQQHQQRQRQRMLAFDAPSTTTFTPAISGSGGLTQMASSLLTLTGNNTYTGPTTIAAGTLQIGNGSTGGIGSTSEHCRQRRAGLRYPSGNDDILGPPSAAPAT